MRLDGGVALLITDACPIGPDVMARMIVETTVTRRRTTVQCATLLETFAARTAGASPRDGCVTLTTTVAIIQMKTLTNVVGVNSNHNRNLFV